MPLPWLRVSKCLIQCHCPGCPPIDCPITVALHVIYRELCFVDLNLESRPVGLFLFQNFPQ